MASSSGAAFRDDVWMTNGWNICGVYSSDWFQLDGVRFTSVLNSTRAYFTVATRTSTLYSSDEFYRIQSCRNARDSELEIDCVSRSNPVTTGFQRVQSERRSSEPKSVPPNRLPLNIKQVTVLSNETLSEDEPYVSSHRILRSINSLRTGEADRRKHLYPQTK